MKKILQFVILTLLVSQPGFTEEIFTKVPIWGGEVNHIQLCLSSPTIIYAGGMYGNLWISKDAGESWQDTNFRKIAGCGTQVFVVHPDSAGVVVAVAMVNGRLFRSEDYGQTWSDLTWYDTMTNNIIKIVFSPNNHNTFYMLSNDLFASKGLVYRSTDSGKTWTKTTSLGLVTGKPIYDICVNKDGTLFLSVLEAPVKIFPFDEATAGYLFKSTDNGETWQDITSKIGPSVGPIKRISASLSCQDTVVAALAVRSGVGSYGIWTSMDAGGSFVKIGTTTAPDVGTGFAITVSSEGSKIYCNSTCTSEYDLSQGRIRMSSYTATGWSEFVSISTSVLDGKTLLWAGAILIDPINTNNMYVCDWYENGFYKSTDTGNTWYVSNKGLAGLVVYDGCKSPKGDLYVVGSANVYKSTDTGNTWNKIFRPSDLSGKIDNFCSGIITTNPDTTKDYVYACSESGLYLSKDGGQTWSLVLPEANRPAKTLVFNPSNPAVGYIAFGMIYPPGKTSSRYIYKTYDYGESWHPLSLEGMSVQALAIDPQDPTVLYAGLGEVSRKQNKSVVFGGLWKITDKGEVDISWSKIGLDNKIPYCIAIDTTNTNVIYAACIEDLTKTMGPVYVSDDKGVSWKKVGGIGEIGIGDFWTGSAGALDIEYSYPAFYFACFDGIFYSVNNGITFQKLIDKSDIGSVKCFILGSLYAGTDSGLWRLTKPPQLLTYIIEKPKVYAFPNPFNANRGYTVLKYFVPQNQTVTSLRISIYNIAGELVYEFPEETNLSGGYAYYYAWDGRNEHKNMCAEGVYIFVFKSNLDVTKTKVVLIKE